MPSFSFGRTKESRTSVDDFRVGGLVPFGSFSPKTRDSEDLSKPGSAESQEQSLQHDELSSTPSKRTRLSSEFSVTIVKPRPSVGSPTNPFDDSALPAPGARTPLAELPGSLLLENQGYTHNSLNPAHSVLLIPARPRTETLCDPSSFQLDNGSISPHADVAALKRTTSWGESGEYTAVSPISPGRRSHEDYPSIRTSRNIQRRCSAPPMATTNGDRIRRTFYPSSTMAKQISGRSTPVLERLIEEQGYQSTTPSEQVETLEAFIRNQDSLISELRLSISDLQSSHHRNISEVNKEHESEMKMLRSYIRLVESQKVTLTGRASYPAVANNHDMLALSNVPAVDEFSERATTQTQRNSPSSSPPTPNMIHPSDRPRPASALARYSSGPVRSGQDFRRHHSLSSHSVSITGQASIVEVQRPIKVASLVYTDREPASRKRDKLLASNVDNDMESNALEGKPELLGRKSKILQEDDTPPTMFTKAQQHIRKQQVAPDSPFHQPSHSDSDISPFETLGERSEADFVDQGYHSTMGPEIASSVSEHPEEQLGSRNASPEMRNMRARDLAQENEALQRAAQAAEGRYTEMVKMYNTLKIDHKGAQNEKHVMQLQIEKLQASLLANSVQGVELEDCKNRLRGITYKLANSEKTISQLQNEREQISSLLHLEIRRQVRALVDSDHSPSTLENSKNPGNDIEEAAEGLRAKAKELFSCTDEEQFTATSPDMLGELQKEIDYYVKDIVLYKLDVKGYKKDLKRAHAKLRKLEQCHTCSSPAGNISSPEPGTAKLNQLSTRSVPVAQSTNLAATEKHASTPASAPATVTEPPSTDTNKKLPRRPLTPLLFDRPFDKTPKRSTMPESVASNAVAVLSSRGGNVDGKKEETGNEKTEQRAVGKAAVSRYSLFPRSAM